MQFKLRFLAQKTLAVFLMVGFFFSSSAQIAHAQWATTNPDVLANDLANTIQSETKGELKGALLGALAGIGISLLDYVATLTAQSTAVWIANGGAGKHPLFNSQTMEEIGQSVSATVVSDVLDQVVPGAGALLAVGIDPNNPQLTGVLRKMLGSSYRPVELTEDGRLDGGSIGRNFSSYIASTAGLAGSGIQAGGAASMKILGDIMNASSANEFYGLLRTYGQTQARAANLAQTTQFENIINAGFQDLTSPISNRTNWPAANVKKKLDDAIAKKQDTGDKTGTALIAAAGENAVIQVGVNFLTTFAGTLFGELTNKLFDGLFEGINPVTVNPFDPNSVAPGRGGEELFRSLGAFRPLQVTGYSLTAQLASCPATLLRSSRGLYTCAMDTSFITVVTRGNSNNPSTVREAIESGEINGNWTLRGPDSTLNKDQNCYQSAFCHSNLIKLRKARIIPLGWEMAAELSGDGKYTLKQVMDGFYDCNAEGGRDAEHPFCKLIDPNWILRAPEAVCRTLGYGQQLATSAGANRAEECVDIQTCLEEGPDGKCKGGYGYCVREANVWRFRGDACTSENASCQTLATRSNQQVSYLLNTVDYATCGPDKTGCRWYETEKTIDAQGAFDWPTVSSLEDVEDDFNAHESRVYTNATAVTCDDGGCRELISRDSGLVYNMVQNGSFEDDKDTDRFPDGWLKSTTSAQTLAGKGVAGGVALAVSTGTVKEVHYPGLLFQGNREYTFTAKARVPEGGASNVTVSASLQFNVDRIDDGAVAFGTETVGGVQKFAGYRLEGIEQGVTCRVSGTNTISVTRTLTPGVDYATFGCIFTVPNLPDTIRNMAGNLTLRLDGGSAVWFDDIQIEQRASVSAYTFGYSGAGSKVYAKVPPVYLGCTGGPNDPAECGNYAKLCSPADEGCRLYSPTNGDPSVSAIVGAGNACPAVCSGYDTFKQEPTFYEPEGVFPEYFIASTARTCNASAAGCDEFTNLTTSDKEYFSYLRACLNTERAGEDAEVFYTWEGSDTAGYQIKTWNLLGTNMGEASADNPLDANAPCTNWTATAEGISCADDVSLADGVPDSVTATCDERIDIFANPDCREFYDANGGIHYRLWSKTVTVNDACTSYRKTEIAGADAAAKQDICETSGGYFDVDNGSCVYYGFKDESISCSASENGCRIYTGGRGNNARIVFQDLFERGSNTQLLGWDGANATDITKSTESLANTGHSIKSIGRKFWVYYASLGSGNTCNQDGGCTTDRASVLKAAADTAEQCTILKGDAGCGPLYRKLATGKTYTLQFWAKGSGTLKVGFAEDTPSDESQVAASTYFTGANGAETITLSSEWKQYTLGPLDMNALQHEDFGQLSTLVFEPASNATVYVDTVVLREGEENLALIRDSWSTPAVCDTDTAGAYAPQFNLGCREYNSSAGSLVYLKSFSRLCGEDKVGCSAFYDTQASESPYGAVYNASCERVLVGTGSVECRLESDLAAADGYNASSPRLCTIRAGEDSCTFNLNYYLPQANLSPTLRTAHINYAIDTEVVNPDMPVYAVVTPGSQCNSADAGCTEVGVPVLSADQSRVDSWQTTSILLDPDKYSDMLCKSEDLFCEEFTDPGQNKYYFRDPQQKVCEFKDKVTINGVEYSGWFVKGTTNFCYGVGTCEGSTSACVVDSDCPITVDPAFAQAGVVDGVAGTYGRCSVFGTACSQDSDCRLNESCLGVSSGVCRKDRQAGPTACTGNPAQSCSGRCDNNLSISCNADADCGTGNSCITPYIISGNQSGLWKAGDDKYDGWAGTCNPENSGCREFVDPLDGLEADTPYGQSDNKSYYYIENNNLGDSNSANGQRCNGQASTEEGCVLFYDTSLPRLSANTSATSIASTHADTLFGKRKYDLVSPIDCSDPARSKITTPNGQVVDLCAQRCVYDQFKVNDVGANYDADGNGVINGNDAPPYNNVSDFFGRPGAEVLTSENLDDAYIFGGSCLVDLDCADMRSAAGDLVSGSCRGVVFNQGGNVAGNTTAVPRLSNDTNRVLKVNRNRTCAEWIAPDDCRKVWDPELNQFRQSCSRLILCEEYDESGAFACKKPKKLDAAVPIDQDFYTSRDTSWYGNDYSGYAVGGQFLLNHLTQEVVTPAKICMRPGDSIPSNPTACENNSDCTGPGVTCENNPNVEYGLAYNAGSCSGDFGSSCTVGYCADSGAACSDDDQCAGSSCIVGRCVAPVLSGGQPRRCQQDSDCGNANATCNAGICEEDLGAGCRIADGVNDDGDVDPNFGCGAIRAGAICNVATGKFKAGTCFSDKCLLTPEGQKYPVGNEKANGVTTFGKVCRANPEIDAPFSTDIVEKWNLYDGEPDASANWSVTTLEEGDNVRAYPYDIRSQFENANICAAGEVCECSYTKFTASGKTQYVELASDIDKLESIVSEDLGVTGDLGICAGGPADGAFCIIDAIGAEYGCKTRPGAEPGSDGAAQIGSGSFGTCNLITREDDLVGLKGYCLERDSAIYVNGDSELGACLTYFPIDELRGESDLYGKYKEAGFFEDAFYCGEVRNYANLGVVYGCAENQNDGSGYDGVDIIECPSGYVAFATDPPQVGNSELAQMCAAGDDDVIGNHPTQLNLSWNTNTQRVMPFMCIPKDSFFSQGNNIGDSCVTYLDDIDGVDRMQSVATNTRVYYLEAKEGDSDNSQAINDIVDELATCLSYGYDLEEEDDHYGIRSFMNAAHRNINSAATSFYLFRRQNDIGGDIDSDIKMQGIFSNAQFYPACRDIVQISDAQSGFVRTDSFLNKNLLIDIFDEEILYDRQTQNARFGATLSIDELNRANAQNIQDPAPAALPTCTTRTRLGSGDWKPLEEFEGTTDVPVWWFVDLLYAQGGVFDWIVPGEGINICNNRLDKADPNEDDMEPVQNYGSQRVEALPYFGLGLIGNVGRYSYMHDGSSVQCGSGRSDLCVFDTYGVGGVEVGLYPDEPDQAARIQTLESPDRIKERLSLLSANPLALWLFDDIYENLGGYREADPAEIGEKTLSKWDHRKDVNPIDGYVPQPPVLYSVDFSNCKGSNCREGQTNQLTVNAQVGQDFSIPEDGFFRASLEFFAAAAKEQLPIRRVIIDWGDGDEFSGSDTDDNFYKNHRGLNDEDQSICGLGEEWGQNSASCNANWLRYTHTYQCGERKALELVQAGRTCGGSITTNCYDDNTQECVFTPRVHVRDNWGWCTGTCDEANGCFSAQELGAIGRGYELEGNQCNYQILPSAGYPNTDPWVYYGGEIRIKKQD